MTEMLNQNKEQKTGKGKVIITMTKLKYYEASVDDDNFAVVEATSPGQAKNKFINGNVVPFFAGYMFDEKKLRKD